MRMHVTGSHVGVIRTSSGFESASSSYRLPALVTRPGAARQEKRPWQGHGSLSGPQAELQLEQESHRGT